VILDILFSFSPILFEENCSGVCQNLDQVTFRDAIYLCVGLGGSELTGIHFSSRFSNQLSKELGATPDPLQ